MCKLQYGDYTEHYEDKFFEVSKASNTSLEVRTQVNFSDE